MWFTYSILKLFIYGSTTCTGVNNSPVQYKRKCNGDNHRELNSL